MKNKPLLTSTSYCPPATWLLAARNTGSWEVEAHENFQKGGWRNRCQIAGPNGLQLLTVPLEKGKHQKKPIQEVRISYRNDWGREHEQAIKTAYGRSPFYEFYAEELFAVLHQKPVTLWQLNQELTKTICTLLQWPVRPSLTKDFILPGNHDYLRPAELPAGLLPYQQVFTDRHGFLPGLSVLDGLFCLGPQLLTSQM